MIETKRFLQKLGNEKTWKVPLNITASLLPVGSHAIDCTVPPALRKNKLNKNLLNFSAPQLG